MLKKNFGNMIMIAYGIVTALSVIFIHDVNQHVSPLLSAFYTFLFCAIFYTIFTFRKMIDKFLLIQKHFNSIFMLNLTTAICWIFSFYALKYISPAFYLFVYLCAMPISGALIYKKNLGNAVILLLGLMLLYQTYHEPHLLLGTLLAFMGGASGTIYSIYSKKIVGVFSSLEILSLRFYLIIGISAIVCLYNSELQIMELRFYLTFSFLSLFSIVLPLTLFQEGLKKLSIPQALSYLPLAPLLCYFIGYFQSSTTFNSLQWIAVLILTIALLPGEKILKIVKPIKFKSSDI